MRAHIRRSAEPHPHPHPHPCTQYPHRKAEQSRAEPNPYTHTPTHLHTYTPTHLHTYTHTPTHPYTYTPTHTPTHTHTHTRTRRGPDQLGPYAHTRAQARQWKKRKQGCAYTADHQARKAHPHPCTYTRAHALMEETQTKQGIAPRMGTPTHAYTRMCPYTYTHIHKAMHLHHASKDARTLCVHRRNTIRKTTNVSSVCPQKSNACSSQGTTVTPLRCGAGKVRYFYR